MPQGLADLEERATVSASRGAQHLYNSLSVPSPECPCQNNPRSRPHCLAAAPGRADCRGADGVAWEAHLGKQLADVLDEQGHVIVGEHQARSTAEETERRGTCTCSTCSLASPSAVEQPKSRPGAWVAECRAPGQPSAETRELFSGFLFQSCILSLISVSSFSGRVLSRYYIVRPSRLSMTVMNQYRYSTRNSGHREKTVGASNGFFIHYRHYSYRARNRR